MDRLENRFVSDSIVVEWIGEMKRQWLACDRNTNCEEIFHQISMLKLKISNNFKSIKEFQRKRERACVVVYASLVYIDIYCFITQTDFKLMNFKFSKIHIILYVYMFVFCWFCCSCSTCFCFFFFLIFYFDVCSTFTFRK